MTIGVYAITNIANGKDTVYIGSSVDIERRWWNHKSMLRHEKHTNSHLQRSFDKYGEDAFQYELLEECATDNLVAQEQKWLDWAVANREYYNIARDVTMPMLGRTLSEEHKKKISAGMMGRSLSPGHLEMLRGKPRTEETKRKIGIANRGKKRTLIQRERNAEAIQRAHARGAYGEEWRRNNADAHRGHVFSEETKLKIGASNAGSYPSLVNMHTGERIPEGKNLSKLCRRWGLTRALLSKVIAGRASHHKGWVLQTAIKAEGL